MQIRFDDSFNWLAVLKDLAGGMEITKDEHDYLHLLAVDWPTCACGQLCKKIPKTSASGGPVDGPLRSMGVEFMENVKESEWKSAIKTFRRIESRTAKLLQHADPRQD